MTKVLINDFGEETAYGELAFKRAVVTAMNLAREQLVQESIASLAASSVARCVAPCTGTLVAVGITLHGALTSGNCVVTFATDEATPETFAAVTDGAVTCVQAGSAEGTFFSNTVDQAITRGRTIRATNAEGSQDATVTGTVWAVIRTPTFDYLAFTDQTA